MKRTSLHPQVKHRLRLRRWQCLRRWPSEALSSPLQRSRLKQWRKVSQQMRAQLVTSLAKHWEQQIDQALFEKLSAREWQPLLLSDGKSHHPVFTSANTLELYGPAELPAQRGLWGTTEDTKREQRFLVIGPTTLELRTSSKHLEW